jgi:hypothetical protein
MANLVGDNAVADFAACVGQYNKLFGLTAESVKPTMETSLSEWIRASIWWFLKGRAELETIIHPRSPITSESTSQGSPSDQSKQAVVNLAKAWWISQHIVPHHPELEKYGKISTGAMLAVASGTGDQWSSNLIGLHQSLLRHLRGLAMSMKRNGILPTPGEMALGQRVDATIWVRYPFFTPDISSVLSGVASRSMLVDRSTRVPDLADMMPMGDTGRYFNYGRMFVDAYLSSIEDESQQYAIPCVLSIIRDRTDWHVIAAITSQNELVNIVIQSDKKQGPTWDDVDWQVRSFSMRLRLPRGFELDVHFNQTDFKMIWKIVDYTRRTESSFQPEPVEKLIFEDILKVFQYIDSGTPRAFPPEPSQGCRIRLFERSVTITEGTGSRKSHRGFRLVLVTNPEVKTLSCVSHILGDGAPIVFGYLRGEDGAPALLLKLKEGGRSRSMLLTFHELEQRSKIHSLILGIISNEKEVKTSDIPMRSYSMEQLANKSSGSQAITHLQFSAPSISVINIDSRHQPHGYSTAVLSENLRVFVTSNWGSVTDRVNLGVI